MPRALPPAVENYGSMQCESFQRYLARWPAALSNFPANVIEFWVHRHWHDFKEHWTKMDLEAMHFELKRYTNEEVMQIGHFPDWFETLDGWGKDLFVNPIRRNSWLGKYMLEQGTVPEPPILAINAVSVVHRRGHKGELMQVPSHLIEGHLRLAYLRGMIRRGHMHLRPSHLFWEMRLGVPASSS